jgi:hypothetical protein
VRIYSHSPLVERRAELLVQLRPQDSEYLARQLYAAAMEHLPWSVEDFHALAFTELLNSTTATVEQREICAMFVCLSGVVWASYEDYVSPPLPSEREGDLCFTNEGGMHSTGYGPLHLPRERSWKPRLTWLTLLRCARSRRKGDFSICTT